MKDKSYGFARRIVKPSQYLQMERKEFVLSKQVLRSGTAIGALIREAKFAESDADYTHKFSISLKEANESLYWLDLLHDTNYLETAHYKSIQSDCKELIAMLVTTIKTLKDKR